jgi:membrane-associated phospholipid phosphatase
MSGHAFMAPARAPQLVHERERGDPATGSPFSALAVAGLLAIGLALVWAVAELIPAVRLKDAVALYEFTTLNRPRVNSASEFLLHLLDPSLFILWAIALVAAALAAERVRVAVAVGVVLALAPLSAELLKPLLAHKHDHVGGVAIGAASWPSGHATAATVLALCAVLVAPRRLRKPTAVVSALFVVAVSISLLVLAWHMPSDVLGGVLLASLWIAVAIAALRAFERIRPSRRGVATRAAGHALPAPP